MERKCAQLICSPVGNLNVTFLKVFSANEEEKEGMH